VTLRIPTPWTDFFSPNESSESSDIFESALVDECSRRGTLSRSAAGSAAHAGAALDDSTPAAGRRANEEARRSMGSLDAALCFIR
jgi:hypothetical protein